MGAVTTQKYFEIEQFLHFLKMFTFLSKSLVSYLILLKNIFSLVAC